MEYSDDPTRERIEAIQFDGEKPRGSASAVVHHLEVYVPLGGLIDLNVEKARLVKEQDRLQKLVFASRAKLNNEKFIQNADPEVVEAERSKLASLEAALDKVVRYVEEINAISEA